MRRWLAIVLAALLLGGCAAVPEKEEPVTVTLWHVYGAQTDSPLNDLIEEFNSTAGREQGVRVEVTLVSGNESIHNTILAAAHGDPGALQLPDMFVTYPKTVAALPDPEILADYRKCFTPEELDAFVPAFLEEGMTDGRLTVLPVAKSTEVMYVNRTEFEKFSAACGVPLEQLDTWEGLFAAAREYARWTDSLTPDRAGDGRALLAHDFLFHYFQVGTQSLGEDFFEEDHLAFGPRFEEIWQLYADAALEGGVWLRGGYGTEPMRTGDAIVSIGSSAGVLYFSDRVTYPDNTSEQADLIVRPCPVFAGGRRMVIQRGAGICTVRSTPEREQACMTFLRWLTDPAVNVEFATRLGYLPVTEEALRDHLPGAVEALTEERYRRLYAACVATRETYEFYTPPLMEEYLELETRFEEMSRSCMRSARSRFLKEGGDPAAQVQQAGQELKEALGR